MFEQSMVLMSPAVISIYIKIKIYLNFLSHLCQFFFISNINLFFYGLIERIISTIVDTFLSWVCQFFSYFTPLHSLVVMSKYRTCLKHWYVYQPNLQLIPYVCMATNTTAHPYISVQQVKMQGYRRNPEWFIESHIYSINKK